ncbi:MAG: cytochrome c oxidase assembly protein [Desertimonas sp.]
MLAQEVTADPFRFQAHPAVWLLVGSLIAAYVYMVKVVGPHAVPAGQPVVTRRQVWCFVAAIALLWTASDWPMHDLGEDYLYSSHMLQHMMLSYFMPPLALMATPEWLLRTLIGGGRLYRVVRWLCRPVVAGVLFNLAVMVSHIPGVVNTSVDSDSSLVHYSVHVMVVMTSLLMWMCVCGPLPEMRIGPGATMIYLFMQSIVPSVPAGWLAFADGIVYDAYDQPVRVWGIDATADQQIAGAIMKTGGTIFLWSVIITLWFRYFSSDYRRDQAEAFRPRRDEPLTYGDVEREFAGTAPAAEPTGPLNG